MNGLRHLNRTMLLPLVMPALFIAVLIMAVGLACNLGAQPTAIPLPTPTFAPVVATITPVVATATRAGVSVIPSSTSVIAANCTVRTDWFTYTVQTGDTLGTIATRANTSVAILQQGNCLANANLISVGQRVYTPVQIFALPTSTPVPATAIVLVSPLPGCTQAWFFSPANVPTLGCPASPIWASGAAWQQFQNGRALYYAVNVNGGFSARTVYILYSSGTWQQYPDTFDGNIEQASDPAIQPPAGLLQPVRAIGKVWRSYPDVRNALGFATANEADFAGRRQYLADAPAPGTYAIDTGLRQVVILNSNGTWTPIGTY